MVQFPLRLALPKRAVRMIPLGRIQGTTPAGRTAEDVRPDWAGLQNVRPHSRGATPMDFARHLLSAIPPGNLRQWRAYLPGGSATRMARLIALLNAGTQPAAFGKLLAQGLLGPDAKAPRVGAPFRLEAPYPPIIESLLKSVFRPRRFGPLAHPGSLPASLDETELATILLAHALELGRPAFANLILARNPSADPELLSRSALGRLAARADNAPTLHGLLRRFAPVVWRDAVATAVAEARDSGHAGASLRLIAAGYDPNHPDREGFRPLERLLAPPSAAGMTHLSEPLTCELLSRLLAAGATPDLRGRIRSKTPLHLAAAALRPNALKLLLPHTRAIDGRDDEGLSPLLIACRALADYAGPHSTRYSDVCPAAPETEHDLAYRTIESLLNAGAYPDLADMSDSVAPLNLAVTFNRPDILALLLRHGANPDLASQSPLEQAVASDFDRCACALLAAGANLSPLLRLDAWVADSPGDPAPRPRGLRTLARIPLPPSAWNELLSPFPEEHPELLAAIARNPSLPEDIRAALLVTLS